MPNFLGLQCYLVLGSFPVACPGVGTRSWEYLLLRHQGGEIG